MNFSKLKLHAYKRAFIITFVLISIASCSDDDSKKIATSDIDVSSFIHNGVTREYFLYVPDSYDGSEEVPLLFNFHGFGGYIAQYISSADMRSIADEENFILVYPQGTLSEGSPHWNAGLESPQNKSEADDFGFIEALIGEISSSYQIDQDRVYACGYSNGAFFSYALACYNSDMIAAIGAVSGTMIEETFKNCNPSHPTPVIILHGTSDNVVPYDGSTGLKSIDEVLTYWIDFNNTNPTATINRSTLDGRTIEQYLYLEGDNNISIEHYRIANGGHVWFDINYEDSNTGRLVWDFVSRYDINGSR